MKRFKEWAKPREIDYGSFKIEEKIDPYTISPFCKDYHGNYKGSNNLNIYRADNKFGLPKKVDKNLSKEKYSIQRRSVHDLTLSRKQLDVKEKEKDSTFFKKVTLSKDEYGLYTMGQNGQPQEEKKISALQLLKTASLAVFSIMENLLI